MKNAKKIFSISSLAVMLLAIFMLTGCSKTSTTTDAFKELAEENGLTTMDATSQFAQHDFIEEVTLAISEDQSYQFEFYVMSDKANAKSFFEHNKAIFEKSLTGVYSQSQVSGNNFANYSATTNNSYMFIEYVDNTVLYINVDKEYKSDAKEFIEGLDY